MLDAVAGRSIGDRGSVASGVNSDMFEILAKGNGRTWMVRLFIGGFCLLLLGIFLKVVSRIL
jgi:hypothetical protein